jgi:D-sedoheptulose 7-phosphate isomerase
LVAVVESDADFEARVATRVRERLDDLAAVVTQTRAAMPEMVAAAATLVRHALQRGGKLLLCGNGGSAADAQHIATEYVVRYMVNRRALAAIALTTDTSILTAGGNDLGFDEVFARQVEALGRPGDLLIIHSTSGNSPNVIRAAVAARRLGIPVVAFSSRDGGQLREHATVSIVVPTDRTDRAQEMHLHLEHVICEVIEQVFA